MMEVKNTISTIFIVPTLGIKREDLIDNNFINAYIKDINREIQYENAAYLLFKPDNMKLFQYFLDSEYDRTESIIDDYDYDRFIVLVYSLNPDFKEDFNLIKQGRYSKTSKEFQNLIPKVKKIMINGKHKDELSLQHRIFHKTDDLKKYWEEKTNVEFKDDMEFWSTFEEENETLNIKKIKELVA